MKLRNTIIFVFLIVLYATAANAGNQYPTSNPFGAVRIFNFNSSSGSVAIDSTGLSNGSTAGGATWVTGQVNFSNALELDSTNGRMLTDWTNGASQENYWTNLNNEISISLWINTTGANVNNHVMGVSDADSTYFQIKPYSANGMWVRFQDAGGASCQLGFGSDWSTNFANNEWHNIILTKTSSNDCGTMAKAYLDGSELSLSVVNDQDPSNDTWNDDIMLNARNIQGTPANYLGGQYDDLLLFNSVLSDTQIATINEGNYTKSVSNFSVTATDFYNNSEILNFSVEIVGNKNYTTTTGIVTTNLLSNSSTTYNIIVNSNVSGGYYNETYNNYAVTENLAAKLKPLYLLSINSYSNYTEFQGKNYTRDLFYSINYTCPKFAESQVLLNAENVTENLTIVCSGKQQKTLQQTYRNFLETEFNISFFSVTNYKPIFNNLSTRTQAFTADLNNPTLELKYNISNNFNTAQATAYLTCQDTLNVNLTYNITANNVLELHENKTNGTQATKQFNLVDGTNSVTGTCSDFFSSSAETINRTAYVKYLYLINEKTGGNFGVGNLSNAKVFFDDNSTVYDLKGNNTNNVNFTSLNNDKLRVELEYSDGETIVRYIDVSLPPQQEVRICANTDPTTHFEQLIISASKKAALLEANFANCLVAADYTRFAYQDSFVLKAYTINNNYNLYKFTNNSQVLLASLDGSIQTFINLDTIEFSQTAYDLSVLSDTITFNKISNSTIEIYYINLENDNTAAELEIKNLDTGNTVLTSSSFTNPNNITVLFDYTTLSDINETTLFSVTITKTTSAGQSVIKRYFNTGAKTGIIPAGVGFTTAAFILFFGLTFTISRQTFSWLGILICLAAVAILSLSISTWYTSLLTAIALIVMIYIGILTWTQNYPTLT